MTENRSDRRSRSHRWVPRAALALLAVAVSLTVAACGGSSKTSSSAVAAAPASSSSTSAVTTVASPASPTTRTIVAPTPSSTSSSSTTATTSSSSSTAAGGQAATVSISAGKTIFITTCGGCHTLADAHTAGSEGPNLDQLMPSDAVVTHQVINGGGVMPAFGKNGQLTTTQIADVAKYVSSVAGKK